MHGLHIRPSDSIKYLSIYPDNNLSGKHEYEEVKAKLKQAYGMLSMAYGMLSIWHA